MAIVFDAGAGSGPIFANTRAWAHTVGANDGRVLIAGLTSGNPVAVNAWTFAGVPMVLLGTAVAGNERTWMYGMVSPPIGVNNVVVNLSGNTALACGSASYVGVDTVNPYGPVATNTGNTNTPTVDVASGDGEVVVDTMGYHGLNSATTIGALQTQRVTVASGVGLPGYRGSEEPGAPTVTMSWIINAGAAEWRTVGISLKPFVPFVPRATEYEFNVWDPLQRIIGRDGHMVQPNEVRADKWGKLLGFRSPSSKVFASLADSPDAFYISGVTSDGETVRITPDEKLFADMILKRITR